jgi:hypothetical protein
MENPAIKVAAARVAGAAAVKIAPTDRAKRVVLRMFANMVSSKDRLISLKVKLLIK